MAHHFLIAGARRSMSDPKPSQCCIYHMSLAQARIDMRLPQARIQVGGWGWGYHLRPGCDPSKLLLSVPLLRLAAEWFACVALPLSSV